MMLGEGVRTVFSSDSKKIIRTIIYPMSLGRSFGELCRVVLALQTVDAFSVATPADWRPGDDVIVPTAGSSGARVGRPALPAEGGSSSLRSGACLDLFWRMK